MAKKPDVQHADGPFTGVQTGDVLQIIYHGAQTALMQVTRVKNFAIQGLDGEIKCKITLVGKELRFRAQLTPVRESILRDIQFKKVEP